ncbi:hypothetical protein SAMN05421644_11631 [Allochromatium warmingii]|uniref:DUF3311 domain-containing protein n=1 Tax=Allochromatium warmingii TaxID=61595 RepID=A0A1H3F4M0_ALLWA|nr:hypothetical protein [Allochromatium warmingii]SDX85830.1 hypothetical protein SAMN05421644_11631 [Allochromatium warmingii]
MPRSNLFRQRLLVLFLLALLLLFSPLAMRPESAESWFGLPALFVYLYAVWAGVIVLAAWIAFHDRD